MPTKIQQIESRRTNKNRVEYLIKWKGQQKSTWETRIDLMEDGYQSSIRAFENERKKKEKNEGAALTKTESPRRSVTPPRSRSKSRGTSDRSHASSSTPKKNVSRKSTTPKAKSAKKSASPRRSSRSTTPKPKSAASTRRSATPSRRSSSKKTAASSDNGEFSESSLTKQVGVNEVSEMVNKFFGPGWVSKFAASFVLITSMIANAIIPEIKKGKWQHVDTIVSVLERSTVVPSIVCLMLVLNTRDTRSYNKFVAVCMVWRTAAEILLGLPDPSGLYQTAALASIGVADFAAVAAVCNIMGGSQPKGDTLTQALGALGALILFGSDGVLVLMDGSRILEARFIIMSIALVFLTTSSVLQDA